MKKTIKQYFTRPVCLILSLVLLTGALTVAAITGSPYDTLKKAALDTLFSPNGTYKADISVYINGELYEGGGTKSQEQFSENGRLSINGENQFFYHGDRYDVNTVYSSDNENADSWYSIYLYEDGSDYYPYPRTGLVDLSREDKSVRFAELLADYFVGDLKNNLSISENGGVKTISGTLTSSQIPEIYNAGLSMIAATGSSIYFSEQKTISETDTKRVYQETELRGKTKIIRVYEEEFSDAVNNFSKEEFKEIYGYFNEEEYIKEAEKYTYRDTINHKLISEKQIDAVSEDYYSNDGRNILNLPMEEVNIDYVSGTAQVGEDGYLSDAEGTVRIIATSIFGDKYEIEAVINVSCANMGTTEVKCPIPGIDEIFTKELFESYYQDNKSSGYYGGLYFKLNADGTIDKSSITTEYNFDPA